MIDNTQTALIFKEQWAFDYYFLSLCDYFLSYLRGRDSISQAIQSQAALLHYTCRAVS